MTAPDKGQRRMRDFTTGSIPRHILLFSWPMFAGNLLQALYNTVDSFWVGRFLGPEALAAVSISFPIVFALMAVILGLTMATTTMVAQFRGAGDDARVRRTVANSLLVISGLGLVSSVVGIALRVPILELMRTPPEILEPAGLYLGIFLSGLVPMFLYNVVSAILRGLGDSLTPLRFLAYATLVNIVLDPILIFGVGPIPEMGIRGVALATVIAQTLAAWLTIRYLIRNTDLLSLDRSLWRLDPELTTATFRVGIPAGMQSVVVSFSIIVLTATVNTFGPMTVAAFGAASRIDQFAFLPAFSVSLAISALVGQNLGAGKKERVREIFLWSALLSGAITLCITLIAVIKPTLLLGIFTRDADVLREGSAYLSVVGLSYVPFALMFAVVGVLRGAGDTMASMVISFITLWIIRLPLAVLFAHRLEWGPSGVWWAITVSAVLGLLLNYGYYLSGRWQRRVLAKPQVAKGPIREPE